MKITRCLINLNSKLYHQMPSESRSRSREHSEENIRLPHGAKPITEADYFQKSDEFRLWLKDTKGKYFDELSGDKARGYFRKFVKYWNRGKLSKSLYAGIDSSTIPSRAQTGYKWSFASKASRADDEALQRARASVSAATLKRDFDESFDGLSASSRSASRVQGPTLPSTADMQLAREFAVESREEEYRLKRKRERKEDKDRIEDMVGPREVGREGMMEKKRVKRESDRTFRDKGDEGLEADESTLMGGGDSFKQQIARRDAARQRYQQKNEEKTNTIRERASASREKEDATMAMFQKLAKERFG
ncbi:hypothetical protein J3R30DRAFT_3531646 [Lentinula aciculospora]|uniref:Splicing arginine serine-rich 12 n=1 Tax=Lentinula aciculospora TaxID=153920 RepID=A0A9W8ZZQ3_9AGAR|nr:hypothetical protein J3R30DRAFT_3531646 [Lentinula aciculospora]